MVLNAVDIFRLQIGDKIIFDGNPSLGGTPGYVPDFTADDRLCIKQFVTTGGTSPLLLGNVPFDGSNYDADADPYDIILDATGLTSEGGGIHSFEVSTPQLTEGEYYLLMIDSDGAPFTGVRTIENAALIYVAHQQVPIIGGSVAGVDLDALKRLISMIGYGVKIRDYTFENGFTKGNAMVAYDLDNASAVSIDLDDISDDTYKVASYTVEHVVSQLGDIIQSTSTKDV